MFARFFIDRPIFATVLSVVITLGGAIAYLRLPLTQYPPVTPPTVRVSCSFPGASADVVAQSVAAPIEQQVNGVENMIYMESQSANDGSYSLTVTFQQGVNLNLAQVLVQNRVNLALPMLPPLGGREPVQAERGGDGVEPGRELGVAAELGQAAVGAEEGLLGHLLGLGGVAEHPHRHPEHAMLVRDHQLLEGGGVAGAQPVQEARRVACLRLSHGKTIPRPGSSRVEMPAAARAERARTGVIDSTPS